METQNEKPASENKDPPETAQGTEPKRRPNAKYRLSRENDTGEELVFYYNREQRLEKAPQSVRDMYKDEEPRKFSILRPLIGSRPRAMLFFTIVIMCLIMLIMSFLGKLGGAQSLGGNSLSAEAQKYGGVIAVELKKNIKKNFLFPGSSPYTGAVDLAIFPAPPSDGEAPPSAAEGETPSVFFHRVVFSAEQNEEYSFSVPFDSDDLLVVLQAGENTLTLKVKAKE